MDRELFDIVYHGREERNIEYKCSINWSDPKVKAKITKCILAMSNIRDGGHIVIGVENNAFNTVGMIEEDFDSFNQDSINSHVANFADPFVDITVYREEHDGKKFIIIRVNEFHVIPVVCKKDGEEGLKCGGIYTKPRRKYECALIPSQNEIREIIDIAIEKSLRDFRKKAYLSGLLSSEPQTVSKTSKDEFDKQLGSL